MIFRNIEKLAYLNFINDSSVVYDIGAHIGETISFFNNVTSPKKIYAFEPCFKNFEELKVKTSNFSNVEYFDVALLDRAYSCKTKFRDCRTEERDAEQQITYVDINDFINEKSLERPTFMKIDIEGMESLVLNSFTNIFRLARPIMYVEIHAKPRDLDVQDYKDCPHWVWPEDGGFDFNKLKDFNYEIFSEKHGLLNLDVDWNPSEGDHTGYILAPQKTVNWN